MAEILAGLAVAASVIEVIQISEQVITGCIHYFRTTKEAKTDIQSVIDVVGGLKISLENLKMILDERPYPYPVNRLFEGKMLK
jgi:hypothetical protein